jgi:hypothetical protein
VVAIEAILRRVLQVADRRILAEVVVPVRHILVEAVVVPVHRQVEVLHARVVAIAGVVEVEDKEA